MVFRSLISIHCWYGGAKICYVHRAVKGLCRRICHDGRRACIAQAAKSHRQRGTALVSLHDKWFLLLPCPGAFGTSLVPQHMTILHSEALQLVTIFQSYQRHRDVAAASYLRKFTSPRRMMQKSFQATEEVHRMSRICRIFRASKGVPPFR